MEIYKIAVKLSMTSNAPQVLSVISKQMMGLHGSVKELEGSFKRLGSVMSAGLAVGGATAIAEALKTAADYGKELLDQQNKLARAGVTQTQIGRLTASAYQSIAGQVPTATGADILRTANQLRVVTGSLPKAVAETPDALKIEALLQNLTGQKAEGAGHQLWRSLEMKGLTGGSATQQSIAQKLLETFVQDIAASGGKLTARDFLNAAKTGGAYWQRATPEFLSGPGAVVMADLGGDRFGTALASLGQFMSGALTMSKQQYEALSKVGMIDASKVSVDRGGRVNVGPGGIVGSLTYGNDPFAWVQKVLLPHLNAAGIKEGPERDSILSKIGRNRNVIRMLDMFSDPGFVSQIEKDLRVFRQSKGLDAAYDSYVKNDPKGVDEAFGAQYKSMMQAIGAPLEQAAIPVMSAITSMFTSIGAFAQQHPHIVQEAGFDLVLGPLAGIIDSFKKLGPILNPIGTDIAKLSDAIKKGMSNAFANPFTPAMLAAQKAGAAEFVTTLDRLITAIDPTAKAADVLSKAIVNLGGEIGGALKGIVGWGAGLFHHSSYSTPAEKAALIHAALSPSGAGFDATAIRDRDRASANIMNMPTQKVAIVTPIELKVDGKTLAKVVNKRNVQLATMPLGVHGGPDTYGNYVGPGTTLQPS